MYEGKPGEIDFGSSKREVRVSEGSSYQSTVLTNDPYFLNANARQSEESCVVCMVVKLVKGSMADVVYSYWLRTRSVHHARTLGTAKDI